MEIKHTVEILTKDIQDIEKLVRNLNNYETPPQIEIDLAMSRLRNVYDLLLLISSDLKTDQHLTPPQQAQATPGEPAQQQRQTPKQDQATQKDTAPQLEQIPQQDTAPQQDQVPRQDAAPQQEQIPQQDSGQQKNTAQQKEQVSQQDTAPQQDQPAQQDTAPQQDQVPSQASAPQQAPSQQQTNVPPRETPAPAPSQVASPQESTGKPEETPAPEQPSSQSAGEMKKDGPGISAGNEQKKKEEAKKASILAEKFASDKSLNEKIAPGSGHDLSSKLTGEPIDSIKRNIGINDRFLIIRELLDGNSDAFNDLVQKLDTLHHFDEAYEIIQSSFPDQMEHEGVNLLVRLSRRRYLGR